LLQCPDGQVLLKFRRHRRTADIIIQRKPGGLRSVQCVTSDRQVLYTYSATVTVTS